MGWAALLVQVGTADLQVCKRRTGVPGHLGAAAALAAARPPERRRRLDSSAAALV
jgi:hypothetical protein